MLHATFALILGSYVASGRFLRGTVLSPMLLFVQSRSEETRDHISYHPRHYRTATCDLLFLVVTNPSDTRHMDRFRAADLYYRVNTVHKLRIDIIIKAPGKSHASTRLSAGW
jgi:hypothetical protein